MTLNEEIEMDAMILLSQGPSDIDKSKNIILSLKMKEWGIYYDFQIIPEDGTAYYQYYYYNNTEICFYKINKLDAKDVLFSKVLKTIFFFLQRGVNLITINCENLCMKINHNINIQINVSLPYDTLKPLYEFISVQDKEVCVTLDKTLTFTFNGFSSTDLKTCENLESLDLTKFIPFIELSLEKNNMLIYYNEPILQMGEYIVWVDSKVGRNLDIQNLFQFAETFYSENITMENAIWLTENGNLVNIHPFDLSFDLNYRWSGTSIEWMQTFNDIIKNDDRYLFVFLKDRMICRENTDNKEISVFNLELLTEFQLPCFVVILKNILNEKKVPCVSEITIRDNCMYLDCGIHLTIDLGCMGNTYDYIKNSKQLLPHGSTLFIGSTENFIFTYNNVESNHKSMEKLKKYVIQLEVDLIGDIDDSSFPRQNHKKKRMKMKKSKKKSNNNGIIEKKKNDLLPLAKFKLSNTSSIEKSEVNDFISPKKPKKRNKQKSSKPKMEGKETLQSKREGNEIQPKKEVKEILQSKREVKEIKIKQESLQSTRKGNEIKRKKSYVYCFYDWKVYSEQELYFQELEYLNNIFHIKIYYEQYFIQYPVYLFFNGFYLKQSVYQTFDLRHSYLDSQHFKVSYG